MCSVGEGSKFKEFARHSFGFGTYWANAALAVIVVGLLLASGCSSGSNSQPPPGFSLSPSPSTLSVQPGGNGSTTISVMAEGRFSGSVNLSASNLPSGVTASFNPASATSSSTLTLVANSSAAGGTTTVTVTGTSGSLTETTSISLTITVAGFTLSALPSAFSIQQSGSRTSTVTVNPTNGFSGSVSLTASGMPSGVGADFSPTSTTSTSILSVTVSAVASPGNYALTITGKSGNLTQTVPVSLTVLASPPVGGLPASFFALSNVDPTDDPTTDGMSYGAVGHPDRLAWPYIESARGTLDFTLFDQYVAIAPRTGLNGSIAVMDLTLGMTPHWATSDTSTCRTLRDGVIGCQAPPSNLQDWNDFVLALVQHYDGSTPARPHILYYEIWNEWNLQDKNNGYWTGPIATLVAMQSTACQIIHSDQYSRVLTPSTVGPASTPTDKAPLDLQNYFNAGGGGCLGGPHNFVDGVSFHGIVADSSFVGPYPLPGEGCAASATGCNGSIQAMTNSYYAILQQNFPAGALPPLLDTEGGFESAGITDIDQRAAWLAQFYALQAGLFPSDQMQWVSWYTWGLPGVPGNIEMANKQPDVAGVAYNQVFNWLYTRTPAACTQNGKVWTCPLTGSSGYQAEILWDDSQTCSNGTCTTSGQTAPSWATKMRDLAGHVTSITGGSVVQVGLKPVILENQ